MPFSASSRIDSVSCEIQFGCYKFDVEQRNVWTRIHLQPELAEYPLPCCLETMIRHFNPNLDDTQLLQALVRRSPERENQLQTVVCEEDLREFLDAKDKEVLDKEIDDAARTQRRSTPAS